MKLYKKIICAVLCLIMLVSVVACIDFSDIKSGAIS